MSLQVWMPMINDLKNQGLANTLELTNDGVEKNDNGKIGSCFKITQAKDMGLTPDIWDYTAKDICFGGWIKINKEELNNIIQKYSYDEVYTSGGGCLLGNGHYSGLSLRWRTNVLYPNKTLTSIYIYSFLREEGTDRKSLTEQYSIPFNTWTHVFLVKNIETKKLSLYINGKLFSTTDTIDIPNMEDINFLIAHRGWDYSNGRISSGCFYYNDIRLYDNILSPKEIKEISKGLVLHLPLNQPNRNKNLLPNSLGPFTGIYPNDFTANYKDFKSFDLIVTPEANETITVSFDAKAEGDDTKLMVYLYNNASGRQVSKGISNKGNITTAIDGYMNIPMTNYFSHYWVQYTFNSATPALEKTLLFRIVQEYKGLEYVIKNIKLERGKNDYPVYTSSDEDNLIEYDTSGYGYNGTAAIDSVPIGSDNSPRYRESIKFDTESKRIKISNFNPSGFSDSFSVCWWEKCSDYSVQWMPWCAIRDADNDIAGLNPYHSGGFIFNNTYDGSGNPFKNGENKVPVPPENEWTFLTLTGDGKESKLYVNGQYAGIATFKPLKSTIINLNGDFSKYSKANAELSDFRIYSTVLSDEDILELYNTSLIVNDNGSIMTYELIEE